MADTSGAGVVVAEVDASAIFLFFLKVMVLVLRIRFPLMNSFKDGASQPIKGLSVTKTQMIGWPLVLLIGSDISNS